MDKEIINSENIKMRELLESYLRFRAAAKTQNEAGAHLDEDSLNAFVEGNLTFKESDLLVDHLVGCRFCLHKTAELTELRSIFEAEETSAFEVPARQPSKVSDVLNNLLARIFGGSEQAVFAHSEEEENEGEKKDPAEQDETKS